MEVNEDQQLFACLPTFLIICYFVLSSSKETHTGLEDLEGALLMTSFAFLGELGNMWIN